MLFFSFVVGIQHYRLAVAAVFTRRNLASAKRARTSTKISCPPTAPTSKWIQRFPFNYFLTTSFCMAFWKIPWRFSEVSLLGIFTDLILYIHEGFSEFLGILLIFFQYFLGQGLHCWSGLCPCWGTKITSTRRQSGTRWRWQRNTLSGHSIQRREAHRTESLPGL